MEIERKYLVKILPDHLEQYPCRQIEQGYLSTNPVVRIRRSNDRYILTYKGRSSDSEAPLSDSARGKIYH